MEKRSLLLFILMLALLPFALATSHLCEDVDGDLYVVSTGPGCSNPPGIDCNDNNPNINPGQAESSGTCNDGLDNDCDGYIDGNDPGCSGCEDKDFDSYKVVATTGANCGSIDCDDTNAFLNPGATEICGDGLDNDCDTTVDDGCSLSTQPEGTAAQDVCTIAQSYWADCDGNEITSANEGDSVFLIVETTNCDSDGEVDYTINEHNDGQAPFEVEQRDEDYVKVERGTVSYVGSWLATWLDDGTNDPDPDYYFDFELIESGGATHPGSSGTNDPLEVSQCPTNNPNCGNECTLTGGFLSLGEGLYDINATTYPATGEDCVPSWDCSQVAWSECDTQTGMQYRDTSLCTFTGVGDAQCESSSLQNLATERPCTPTTRPSTRSVPAKKEGEGVPEEGGFPWGWVIFIGIIVILAIVGLAFYLKFKKESKALAGEPMGVKKPTHEVSPFAKASDLTAVINYIKLAKQRGLDDEKIKEMLLKSGWNAQQVDFAFKSLDMPQTHHDNHHNRNK